MHTITPYPTKRAKKHSSTTLYPENRLMPYAAQICSATIPESGNNMLNTHGFE
jgi:hypothetical protein